MRTRWKEAALWIACAVVAGMAIAETIIQVSGGAQ